VAVRLPRLTLEEWRGATSSDHLPGPHILPRESK
jgi:hypothetical protein